MVLLAACLGTWLTVTARTTFLSQAAAVMLSLFSAVASVWASLVFDGASAGSILAGHTAAVYLAAVVFWIAAVRTFRGYAKR
jgi:hypothetical protein